MTKAAKQSKPDNGADMVDEMRDMLDRVKARTAAVAAAVGKPKKSKPKKKKPVVVTEHRIKVRLYKRGEQWWGDVRLNGNRERIPLETTKADEAEDNAREWARETAEMRLLGVKPATLTLRQLFSAYRDHRAKDMSAARQREATTRAACFVEAWGADLRVCDIDATRVRAYCAARRSGKVVAAGLKADAEGKRPRGYREPAAVRDGALDGELRWLNVVLNWACGYKRGDATLLDRNPLPRDSKVRRAWGWPKERAPRRPVASLDRYTRTQEHTDVVDPTGRLRCILALVRYTGRRISAVCGLRASDVLLTDERIRAALAEQGMDEALHVDGTHLYPHGAILWSPELDKMKLVHIAPIKPELRAELERYQRRARRIGDVPLFPAPGRKLKKDARKKAATPPPERPISRDLAAKWLLAAERLAGLPKMRGGAWHPYRRLFASALASKGESDVAIAAAGGWSDTQALRQSYIHAGPADVLRAVLRA
jgi:integrase